MKIYKLPFYGVVYRRWSRFTHKHGYHHMPRLEPIDGSDALKDRYWCQWCGVRGEKPSQYAMDMALKDLEVVSAKNKKKTTPTTK